MPRNDGVGEIIRQAQSLNDFGGTISDFVEVRLEGIGYAAMFTSCFRLPDKPSPHLHWFGIFVLRVFKCDLALSAIPFGVSSPCQTRFRSDPLPSSNMSATS